MATPDLLNQKLGVSLSSDLRNKPPVLSIKSWPYHQSAAWNGLLTGVCLPQILPLPAVDPGASYSGVLLCEMEIMPAGSAVLGLALTRVCWTPRRHLTAMTFA